MIRQLKLKSFEKQWVVYSPSQVLVEKIFEYQEIETKPEPIVTGCCGLMLPAPREFQKGMSSFKDLIPHKACGKTAYRQVQTTTGKNSYNVWICNDCLDRFRIKIGSAIAIGNPISYRGETYFTVKVTSIVV